MKEKIKKVVLYLIVFLISLIIAKGICSIKNETIKFIIDVLLGLYGLFFILNYKKM